MTNEDFEKYKKYVSLKPVIIGKEEKIPNYAIHSDSQICGFFGNSRWLSNFWICPKGIWYQGVKFPAVENAYQSAKIPSISPLEFVNIFPGQAKKLGHGPGIREDWNEIKYDIMLQLVIQKFASDKTLKQKLIDTTGKYLEERNSWGDVWWGTDKDGNGQNKMGYILMTVRKFWI